MALRKILIYPNDALRREAVEVSEFGPELQKLVDDMVQTMYHGIGIGLAAPQIGVHQRVIVLDVSEDGDQPLALINPVITAKEGQVRSDEGCLSIPGYRDIVQRSEKVQVQGFDVAGKEIQVEADALFSRCLQHEIDHLNGVLFVDHLSRMKKEMFRRWARRQEAPEEAPAR